MEAKILTPDECEAFRLGLAEADGDVGMTYDGNPESPRSIAYDVGRTLGRNVLVPSWRALLAAAPDLLDAARARLNEWHADARNMERIEPASVRIARSAIAKATGSGR